jgi:hypothetical protein
MTQADIIKKFGTHPMALSEKIFRRQLHMRITCISWTHKSGEMHVGKLLLQYFLQGANVIESANGSHGTCAAADCIASEQGAMDRR